MKTEKQTTWKITGTNKGGSREESAERTRITKQSVFVLIIITEEGAMSLRGREGGKEGRRKGGRPKRTWSGHQSWK